MVTSMSDLGSFEKDDLSVQREIICSITILLSECDNLSDDGTN